MDVVSDLPPSAKLIVKVLGYNGTLTQSELADKSRLSPRTVRHGLQKVEEADVVVSEIPLVMPDKISTRSRSSPNHVPSGLSIKSLIPIPFDDLSERNGLVNRLNCDPNTLSHLCLWDDHHESTLDTCETVALVAHLRNLDYL